MRARTLVLGLAAASLLLVHARPGFTQSSEELNALKGELDALRTGQAAIRRELEEIKNLLRARAAPPATAPRNVALSVTPEAALTWATRNGYRALGVLDGGWLAPGNRADLIVVDFRRPHLTPALRPVSCFVHQGQAGDVEAVMVDGRWLMREHPRADAGRARHRRRGRARRAHGLAQALRRAAGSQAPARAQSLVSLAEIG